MDQQQAKKLILETFHNPFDKTRFVRFIQELLNEIDESKRGRWAGQMIKGGFGDVVHYYERVGTYTAQEGEKVDILIVYLKKDTTLERARTQQRNFVAHHLKTRAEKEAGLVAFVSPNGEDWRFSLVKMEYHLKQTEEGKVEVKENLTPAKRFSFIVGKNENSHTAQKQLLPILEDDENNPTLKEIEKAFSIETVTKEFFNKYKDLFLNFKEEFDKILEKDKKITADFDSKGIHTADFAKKLLGQIVFLYFLQRKGWLGVDKNSNWGSGPKNFLRALFEKKYGNYKNFFNDILEPLFYEALATDRGDKAYYSRFDCRIPFLNGGLFEPIQNYDWENTDIIIPNELFSNDIPTKEGDKGSGILDFFDRYNFTIKEDEPLEKEVAIDPEMLGKVFENLLEIKDRKSKGAYYTPREIVHYMCQESLINYLATELSVTPSRVDGVPREDIETFIHLGDFAVEHDMAKTQGIIKDDGKYKLPQSIHQNAELVDKKLADITVCDPAIGSGAFPVGMMNEIIRARGALNATKTFKDAKSKRTPYSFKRHAIQNSLYGVDIDPGAVEIAKLRLWLSLVVDEEEMAEIKPLPNLDYKIMQGNSLLEEYERIKLFDERLLESIVPTNNQQIAILEKRETEIQKLLLPFYQQNPVWMNDKKIDRPAELDQFEGELKRVKLSLRHEKNLRLPQNMSQGVLFSDDRSATKIREMLESLHREFFETTQKSKKDNIKKQIDDVVWELIEATLKDQNKLSALKKIEEFKRSNTNPFFLWKLHFAEVFQENGGFDVVIANPPYVGDKGNKEIFRPIRESTFGQQFYIGQMDLFYFFFHLAVNLARNKGEIAFITTNYYLTATGAKKLRQDFRQRSNVTKLINFNELRIFESALGQSNMITMLQKGAKDEILAKTAVTSRTGTAQDRDLTEILSFKDLRTQYFAVQQNFLYESSDLYIRITGTKAKNNNLVGTLNKIKSGNPTLAEICEIKAGIGVTISKITKKYIKDYPNLALESGEGVFVISENKGNKLEPSIIKNFVKNSDIRHYNFKNNKDKLIYLTWDSDINHYPNTKKHLEKFKPILEDQIVRYEETFPWFALNRPRKQSTFENTNKIIVPYRAKSNFFALADSPIYGSRDVFFILCKNYEVHLKYLLAILNSQLYYFWLYHRGKRKGNILEMYQKPLSEIPIKIATRDKQTTFIRLVNQILEISKNDNCLKGQFQKKEVEKLHNEIDQLVYKLYELTPEEIQIIESNS